MQILRNYVYLLVALGHSSLCYNEPWCAQGSDTATMAETQAGDVPPVTPVLDPALLFDVEPIFAHNLAELLDGLGLLNS